MDEDTAKVVLAHLKEVSFYVTVVKSAPVAANFSRIQGSIVYGTSPARILATTLFKVSPGVLAGEGCRDTRAATRRLMDLLSNEKDIVPELQMRLYEESTERMQFLSLASVMLQRLTPVLEMSRHSYSGDVLLEEGAHVRLTSAYLGMGAKWTWHGHPDARAEWTPLGLVRGASKETASDSEQAAGTKTTYEAKKTFSMDDVDQIVAQSVVSSFIHNNRHPEQNPLIPSVGISTFERKVMAVLYDPNLDVLLISSKIKWLEEEEQCFSKPGVVFLWLLLHHQLFLKSLDACQEHLDKSGLVRIFDGHKALGAYKLLQSHNIHEWPPRDWEKIQPSTVPCLFLKEELQEPPSERPRH